MTYQDIADVNVCMERTGFERVVCEVSDERVHFGATILSLDQFEFYIRGHIMTHHVVTVNDDIDITTSDITLSFSKEQSPKNRFSRMDLENIHWDMLYQNDYGYSTIPGHQLMDIATHITNSDIRNHLHIIKKSHADQFINLFKLIKRVYSHDLDQLKLYNNIKTHRGIESIISVIYQLPNPEHYIQKLLISSTLFRIQKPIFDEILEVYFEKVLPQEYKLPLRSQEEQVAAYLELSKTTLQSEELLHEYVSDETIEFIKQTNAYQESLKRLADNGFGVSKTQQFNTLQSVGLFGMNANRYLFNLSDMGSGKTMMTVQTLFVLDYLAAEQAPSGDLPPRHVLAPNLSLKSSWLDTFKLFYTVKETDEENTYLLSFEIGDNTYRSILSLNGFTLKQNGLTVHKKVPRPKFYTTGEYLIVDELHQLSHSNHSRSRFFETPDYENYHTFYLSGTLSDLPTNRWYNLIKLCRFPYDRSDLVGKACEGRMNSIIYDLQGDISSAINQLPENGYEVLPYTIESDRTTFETENKKQTLVKDYFDTRYAPFRIPISSGSLQHLITPNANYHLLQNTTVDDAPNFELFYEIVGDCTITANAETIMNELFTKTAKQNQAQLVKTHFELSQDDLHLLKCVYDLTKELGTKQASLARRLSNAILNINDGLSKDNLYSIINKYASSNQRFIDYLSQLPTDFLIQLSQSQLIKSPDLKETEKFKVLQKIIKDHNEDTLLVVVNDFESMVKLGKALDISVFTKAQTTDELEYQETFNTFFDQQDIVIAPQHMMKSSLDLIQANVLVQYQLNTEIADIIQTQNRINRIGQKRETHAYYIATDHLQEQLIKLFLESYRHIKVAHKGIVELFVDLDKQVHIVNNFLSDAFQALEEYDEESQEDTMEEKVVGTTFRTQRPLSDYAEETQIIDGIPSVTVPVVLMPEPTNEHDPNAVAVIARIKDGSAHHVGYLGTKGQLYHQITKPTLSTMMIKDFTVIGKNASYIIITNEGE